MRNASGRPLQSRPAGSVASYTTLGSGFTAQTHGTVLSRLAARVEASRRERVGGGSYASSLTGGRPDSRLSLASSLAPQRRTSRGATLATDASSERTGTPYREEQAPLPRPRGAPPAAPSPSPSPVQQLPPVQEERASGGSGVAAAAASARPLSRSSNGPSKAALSTAQAMAAHVAAMHAAAAQLGGGPQAAGGNASDDEDEEDEPPRTVPPDTLRAPSRPASLHSQPRSAAPRPTPQQKQPQPQPQSQSLLPVGLPMALPPPSAAPARAKPPPSFASTALENGSDGMSDDGEDVEFGHRGSEAADAPAEERDARRRVSQLPPPRVLLPPEQRCLGVRLPGWLSWSVSGGAAGWAPQLLTGGAPWPARRLADLVVTLSRMALCELLATAAPALHASRAAPRLFATLLVSFLAACGALAACHMGARRRVSAATCGGMAALTLNAAALSSFCAASAETTALTCTLAGAMVTPSAALCAGVARLRATTLVYAWALMLSALPLLAAGALLTVREEVGEAALRAARATRKRTSRSDDT